MQYFSSFLTTFRSQVEAALTNDPTDAELLKLQKDLGEVIELTTDLIRAQAPSASSYGKCSVAHMCVELSFFCF